MSLLVCFVVFPEFLTFLTDAAFISVGKIIQVVSLISG